MFLLAQSGWITGVCLAALALTIAILLRRTHRYLGRQDKSNTPLVRVPRPQQADSRHHLDAPTEVQRWEVAMHETARELSAELDSKLGVLRALIAEADRAAARLEAALAAGVDADDRAEPRPPTQAEALRPTAAPQQALRQRLDEPHRPTVRHRHQEVYTLADYGLSAAEIAGRLGSPVGEIELILGLREKS